MTKCAAVRGEASKEPTVFTPELSGRDVTKFFTPGDKSDETFAADVNVTLADSARPLMRGY